MIAPLGENLKGGCDSNQQIQTIRGVGANWSNKLLVKRFKCLQIWRTDDDDLLNDAREPIGSQVECH